MEDMEESRRILDRNNWDLLAAISNHMGLETGAQHQQFNRAEDYQNQQQEDRQPSSADSSPRPSHSVSRYNNTGVGRAPNNGRGGPGGGGIFGWIWAIFTRPMEFVFRFLWDFIGFGLRFIRADPRRGTLNIRSVLCLLKFIMCHF